MDNEAKITLGLLNAVNDDAQASQRSMAGRLGIALGLANTYIKRCVKKGLIKISHAPANRYAYYLTPQGFSEKSRLTAEFFSQSLNLFRQARISGNELLRVCQVRGWHRVALFGASDLAEILTLSARNFEIDLVCVITEFPNTPEFAGLPLISAAEFDLNEIDAVIMCEVSNPQASFDKLVEILPPERVLAPDLLGVTSDKGVTK